MSDVKRLTIYITLLVNRNCGGPVSSFPPLAVGLPLPKMCQKSSQFPSPSFLEKKEFPREAFSHSWHLRRRCSQSKAALFCLFICCCWCNNISDGGRKQDRGQSASQLLLKRHRAFPRRAGHRLLDFSLREERSFPPFQDLLWGERTGAEAGGYWRSLPANSYGFLIQQIGRGNCALTRASVKISTLGTMSLSPHFSLILLLHLFPHLSHSGISWTAFASSSEAITSKIQKAEAGMNQMHHTPFENDNNLKAFVIKGKGTNFYVAGLCCSGRAQAVEHHQKLTRIRANRFVKCKLLLWWSYIFWKCCLLMLIQFSFSSGTAGYHQ